MEKSFKTAPNKARRLALRPYRASIFRRLLQTLRETRRHFGTDFVRYSLKLSLGLLVIGGLTFAAAETEA